MTENRALRHAVFVATQGEQTACTRTAYSARMLSVPAKGRGGGGTSGIQSQKERRYTCETCDTIFAATKAVPYYRLHKGAWLMTTVLILLAHGCPPQAIVAAFGRDERTITAWLHRAGRHCAAVHVHLAEDRQVELGQVQADEIRIKGRGGVASHGGHGAGCRLAPREYLQ